MQQLPVLSGEWQFNNAWCFLEESMILLIYAAFKRNTYFLSELNACQEEIKIIIGRLILMLMIDE
jgi:hypothetical protein